MVGCSPSIVQPAGGLAFELNGTVPAVSPENHILREQDGNAGTAARYPGFVAESPQVWHGSRNVLAWSEPPRSIAALLKYPQFLLNLLPACNTSL
jgi:hypothetical protein